MLQWVPIYKVDQSRWLVRFFDTKNNQITHKWNFENFIYIIILKYKIRKRKKTICGLNRFQRYCIKHWLSIETVRTNFLAAAVYTKTLLKVLPRRWIYKPSSFCEFQHFLLKPANKGEVGKYICSVQVILFTGAVFA